MGAWWEEGGTMQGYGYGPSGEPPRSPARGRLRVFVSVVMVAFVVTLAVVVGQRLSDEAMAVLAGTVCGVGASIPTSLLIVWVTQRRQEQRRPPAQPGMMPPVVVVQPPAAAGGGTPQQLGYLGPYMAPAQREFNVVGGELEEAGHGIYQ